MADEDGIAQAVLVNEVLYVKGELSVVMFWMMRGVSVVTKVLSMVSKGGSIKRRRPIAYDSVY